MKITNLFRRLARPSAFLLALVMALTCIGCGLSDVQDAIDIAGDVLEIIDGVTSTGNSEPTVDSVETDPPETKPSETKPAETKPTETKPAETKPTETKPAETTASPIDEDGKYYSKDEVALYIHTYSKLPSNFITKKEAENLGWEGGSVERYAKGCAIGGDTFGNREGILPKKSGRTYKECDIDTLGKSSRGAKRIVFSNDGLIYYTDDHYETFTLLYGEE